MQIYASTKTEECSVFELRILPLKKNKEHGI
jgi:hypothetical protein